MVVLDMDTNIEKAKDAYGSYTHLLCTGFISSTISEWTSKMYLCNITLDIIFYTDSEGERETTNLQND